MKQIFLFLTLLCNDVSFAQGVPTQTNQKKMIYFWYDKNGNRIRRQVNTIDCQAMEIPPNEGLITYNGKKGNDTIITPIDPDGLGLKLFPNPTVNTINITINTKFSLEGSSILVYDLNGKLMYEKLNVQNRTLESFSVESFPTGTYLIKLKLNATKCIVWTVEKY